jgi:hypothetical protein
LAISSQAIALISTAVFSVTMMRLSPWFRPQQHRAVHPLLVTGSKQILWLTFPQMSTSSLPKAMMAVCWPSMR